MISSGNLRALTRCHKLYKVVTSMEKNMKDDESYLLIELRLALVKVEVEEKDE